MSNNTHLLQAPVKEPVVKDSVWKTGDFTLISSDGVSFEVDYIHLQSASTFFRDGSGLASGHRTVEFVDADETAEVVRSFLELACLGQLQTYCFLLENWLDDLHYLCKLIRFFRKYGCDASLRQLRQRVELQMVNPYFRHLRLPRLAVFIAGAVADNGRLCGISLKEELQDVPWKLALQPESQQCEMFDLGNLSLELWELIPSRYLWALAQAAGDSEEPLRPDRWSFLCALKVAKGEN